MALVDATPDDIPAIMAIERNPAYALFIGNFPAEEHAARLASDNDRYLVWRENGRVLAFAILTKLAEPHGVVLLKRLGAAATDTGLQAVQGSCTCVHNHSLNFLERLRL